ncbi:MAG: efflux RND transporter periplasmic adaptor subunit [Gammaproteobacteria bacterium]|jgi:RND family efflux transporter MFP subunit|nr:efflux RND transporter periplasmic adaptor subunit [Gammaproteobacteria bacterium]MDP7154566.1 efflux RND transporter periplasmic adaptor subunit [Gammaproteobacteria bacterium]MDP7419565.1 efflux RND transporter periplasmic adaptor subunit [Gammaproteobacteria bacterium]MDP7661081.1 efflux RND transporter periplasmic adaptor subunit [Gammaproteobacteria bacterium]HJP38068.1 efflux RND transporter periplasmic adaptor subunit [Gammaproteobacteria bacterium]
MRKNQFMDVPESTIKPRLRPLLLPLTIIGVTILVIFILMATRPRLEPVEVPERIWNVNVVKAQQGTIQPMLKLFGEVVAGRRSELQPAVSGVMVAIGENFHDGGVVRKDELLVQIDPFDYETDLAEQRSLLKESKVTLEMLRRDYDRAQELFTAKSVSEQFLDSAELDVLQQDAIVEQREIGVRRAQRDLSDTRLVAPFDGVVNSVNAALGKQFSGFGADMVGEVIDTSHVEVRFSLSNEQFGRLLKNSEMIIGRQVKVSWEVGVQALEYTAVIARVGAEITSTTGGVDLFAVIDTSGEQSRLRPGAFVAVQMPGQLHHNAMQVPDTALYGENIIFVVKDERLAQRHIEIIDYTGSDIVFRSVDGAAIVAGDLIVTTRIREGGPGARVAVR